MQLDTAYEPGPPSRIVVESVQQLDALLADDPRKHVVPPRGLEERFFDTSRQLSRLRVITHFYGAHPASQQKYVPQRKGRNPTRGLGHLKTFEQVFADISRTHSGGKLFGFGKVKRFLDLGCSPGGFSNWILGNNPRADGVGITLPDERAQWSMVVAGTHLEKSRYETRFADIVSLAMDAAESDERPVIPIKQDSSSTEPAYDLVIAGAFPSMNENIHLTTRIQLAYGQLLILINNLKPGGNAVVVVTTRAHRWVIEEMALLRQCFAKVSTGKGRYVHQERSSCYLVCTDFRATQEQIAELNQKIRETLRHVSKTQAELDAGEDGRGWDKLLTLVDISGKTEDELFEDERQFVLDFFEPMWQKQFETKYNNFVKLLNNAGE
ncbi:FtsJ-like methyltransferase [Phanerochaete sordida]|uniref:FtsJ-like methyltransferase n=1 Tax=Phanerochaete sordida TaxID=48140 RepID=A0A9P3GAK7_9APHY|nr:FtsJ-like methyltransferase [Phanerochaete sordida]